MKAVNGAVIGSYAIKLIPVLMAVLVTRGCVTEEQAEAATPILSDLLTWVAGGVGVIALVVGWLRSVKSHGDRKE